VWQELHGNPVCLAKLVIASAFELPMNANAVTPIPIPINLVKRFMKTMQHSSNLSIFDFFKYSVRPRDGSRNSTTIKSSGR